MENVNFTVKFYLKVNIDLTSRYIFHLLQCGLKSWSTKIYLIDFAKKLIIKYPDVK